MAIARTGDDALPYLLPDGHMGSTVPLDLIPRADQNAKLLGACFVMQPQRASQAMRVRGSSHDFSDAAEPLLRDFDTPSTGTPDQERHGAP